MNTTHRTLFRRPSSSSCGGAERSGCETPWALASSGRLPRGDSCQAEPAEDGRAESGRGGNRSCRSQPPDDRWRVILKRSTGSRTVTAFRSFSATWKTGPTRMRRGTLGCPIGTVKSRLARGRETATRATRSPGVRPRRGAGWVGLLREPDRAVVPLVLGESTSRAAVWFVTAKGTADRSRRPSWHLQMGYREPWP